MNAKSQNLIAYVFCYDDRATSWLNVLSKQFSAIRLIEGEYTTQNYSSKINGSPDLGVIIKTYHEKQAKKRFRILSKFINP